MLTEYQKAKLIEWAEWVQVNPWGDFPHGLGEVDEWVHEMAFDGVMTFPTAEQMEPTRTDFGLEG